MRPKYNSLRCLVVVVSLAFLQTKANSNGLAEQPTKDVIVVPLKARAFRLEDVRLPR
ncbi:MAG: hypothetical protein OEW48_14175 [Phycisphaerae bacterium]|nr:hypothetical protein [Phycisphaerae bacterium]